MKITYISHATLLIQTENLRIVTDPWVKGSAYCNQWHLFPKALKPDLIVDADFVLYSHGHEDHLHAESLSLINKKAHVFYPYSWFGGTKEFFNELGFHSVTEAISEKTISLSENVKITYLANNLDNVIVIEDSNTVLVDINDALPSASKQMIQHFIQKIKSRWSKIDYVFSSYGGASYFPNTVHFHKKNDVKIAETREQFFLENFCTIVKGLSPALAVPFASDFVLLDDYQRWINKTKFPRYEIAGFFEKKYPNTATKIIEAYPDDVFENKSFVQQSPYHTIARQLIERIDTDYAEEIKQKKETIFLSDKELLECLEKVKHHITNKQSIIPESVRKKIKFAIKITDAQANTILVVDFRYQEVLYTVSNEIPPDVDLHLELSSVTLLYSINNEWGGDAIIIGYGAEIFITNEEAIALDLENYCVRLLSRYPNTKEYLKRTPLRAIKYLLTDTTKRNNLFYKAIRQNSKVINYFDPVLANHNLWLTKNKCEVCKACNL